MVDENRIIMLYTLNLHTALCQLCLNKTGRKKKKNYLSLKAIVYLKKIFICKNRWWSEFGLVAVVC